MGRRRKSDLSSCSRSMRKARAKAQQRRLEQLERVNAMMASLADAAKERTGTSLQDNRNAFSAVAPSKLLKPINLCRNKNNCNIPEPLANESLEQGIQESVTDTENVRLVLDFETEEEMDKRWKDKFQL